MADPKQKSTLTLAQIDEALMRILRGEIASVNGINPNLLDNWFFVNPVNQRGQTEYANQAGYTVDRWYRTASTGGVVSLVDDGIRITNGGTSAVYFRQFFDGNLKAGDYTVSILAQEPSGRVVVYFGYADGTFSGSTEIKAGVTHAKHSSTKEIARLQIEIQSGASVLLTAAKVERGSQQTLAHQDENGNWVLNEIPDYGEQLLKCQRYYQLFSSADARPSDLADYRPSMRANPAVGTIDIGGKTYYFADANL